MPYVYIIVSKNKNKLVSYVGWTTDLDKRLKLHNSNKGAKFTKGKKWKLIYHESFLSKTKAMKREYKLKKDIKFRNFVKKKFLKGKNIEE